VVGRDSIRSFAQSESQCSIVPFSKIKVHATKAHTVVELQIYSFLTSALDGCQRSVSHPGHFQPGKERRYQLNRRTGGHQRKSKCFGEEKSLASAGIRNPNRSIHSIFIYLLERGSGIDNSETIIVKTGCEMLYWIQVATRN